MRIIFILAFVANVVVTLISLAVLPDRVAIHFGAGGMANGWAPNYVNALLVTGTQVLLLCLLFFSHRLILWVPPRWLNLPHKEYWLSPGNRARTVEKMQGLMCRFGVALFLLFFVLGLLSLQANLAKTVRLNLRVFLPAFASFLIYTIWWTIGFYRAFRIPRQQADASKRRQDTLLQ